MQHVTLARPQYAASHDHMVVNDRSWLLREIQGRIHYNAISYLKIVSKKTGVLILLAHDLSFTDRSTRIEDGRQIRAWEASQIRYLSCAPKFSVVGSFVLKNRWLLSRVRELRCRPYWRWARLLIIWTPRPLLVRLGFDRSTACNKKQWKPKSRITWTWDPPVSPSWYPHQAVHVNNIVMYIMLHPFTPIESHLPGTMLFGSQSEPCLSCNYREIPQICLGSATDLTGNGAKNLIWIVSFELIKTTGPT